MRNELTKLAELAVGDEKCAEGAQPLEGFITILLGSILVDGSAGRVDRLGIELRSLPDEVLEEITLVLGQQHQLRLLDYFADVLDELLAVIRELLRGVGDGLGGEEAVEGDIDLLILPSVSDWFPVASWPDSDSQGRGFDVRKGPCRSGRR